MNLRRYIGLILLITPLLCSAQKINQYDAQGRRHGKWMKDFKGTGQIRYEGTFEHGQEVGVFKFYKIPGEKLEPGENTYLFAEKTYTKNSDTVQIEIFTQKGNVMIEGQLKNKKRIGKWVYYERNTTKIIMTEFYVNGKLHGTQTVYFPSGNITKTAEYKDGKLNGLVKIFSTEGTLQKYYTYKDGELDGQVKYYDIDGKLISKGMYEDGKRTGVWKTYENGEMVDKTKY